MSPGCIGIVTPASPFPCRFKPLNEGIMTTRISHICEKEGVELSSEAMATLSQVGFRYWGRGRGLQSSEPGWSWVRERAWQPSAPDWSWAREGGVFREAWTSRVGRAGLEGGSGRKSGKGSFRTLLPPHFTPLFHSKPSSPHSGIWRRPPKGHHDAAECSTAGRTPSRQVGVVGGGLGGKGGRSCVNESDGIHSECGGY